MTIRDPDSPDYYRNPAAEWLQANDAERTRLFGPGSRYWQERFDKQFEIKPYTIPEPAPLKEGWIRGGLGGDYPTFETWLKENEIEVRGEEHRQVLHNTWLRIFL